MTTSSAGRSPTYPTIPHTLSGYPPIGVRSAQPGLASVAGAGQVEGRSREFAKQPARTGVRPKFPSTVATCVDIELSAPDSPLTQVIEHPVPALGRARC